MSPKGPMSKNKKSAQRIPAKDSQNLSKKPEALSLNSKESTMSKKPPKAKPTVKQNSLALERQDVISILANHLNFYLAQGAEFEDHYQEIYEKAGSLLKFSEILVDLFGLENILSDEPIKPIDPLGKKKFTTSEPFGGNSSLTISPQQFSDLMDPEKYVDPELRKRFESSTKVIIDDSLSPGAPEPSPDQGPLSPGAKEPSPDQGPLSPGAPEPKPDQGPLSPGAKEPKPAQGQPSPGTSERKTAQGQPSPGAKEPKPAQGPISPGLQEHDRTDEISHLLSPEQLEFLEYFRQNAKKGQVKYYKYFNDPNPTLIMDVEKLRNQSKSQEQDFSNSEIEEEDQFLNSHKLSAKIDSRLVTTRESSEGFVSLDSLKPEAKPKDPGNQNSEPGRYLFIPKQKYWH